MRQPPEQAYRAVRRMKSFYSNEQIFKSINRAKQCLFVPADKETAAPEAELQEWQRAGIPVDEVLGCAGAGAISGSSTSPTHGGMNRAALRPAVVLAVAYGGMTVVVPLTTTPAAFGFLRTHGIEGSSGNGFTSSSAALVFQIVALSSKRIGRCSAEDMEAISVLLKDLLALE